MIIIGTGGHASDLLSDGYVFSKYNSLYFFDSVNSFETTIVFDKYKVLTSEAEFIDLSQTERIFILAVGIPTIRQTLCMRMENAGLKIDSYISPLALVARTGIVNDGANVMPFASIFGHTFVGKGTLVNSYASLHHDVTTGDFCEISPGARVLGKASIGSKVYIGANATVLPRVTIGDNCIIGAGAVVTENLPNNCTAVGVPAKIIKRE
jgi:sugar O-acyltransferase (sialic acid O-acetyltransferase NeuD family)